MDGATFLGFFLTAFIGFAVLGFLLEFLDPERQPANQREQAGVPEGVRAPRSSHAVVPAFFARPVASQGPTLGSDEGLFAFLQQHVKAEQAMVAEFVHLPSMDSLYRQARPSLTLN